MAGLGLKEHIEPSKKKNFLIHKIKTMGQFA